jgi:beta-lactamase superfamily II metal-dependent hydrolase
MIYPKDPPAADTLEVSIFGKGVGECIVVHAGDGEWFVADSLIDPESARPVALEYLRALGLDPAVATKMVIATHWHHDHTAGIGEIVENSPSAHVVFSTAFRSSEFREILGYDAQLPPESSSLGEMRRVLVALRARTPSSTATPIWAIANRVLRATPAGDMYALSPSDAAVATALDELRSLLPEAGSPKRRFVSQRPNDTCVVLSIRLGTNVVLLGADLEAGADHSRGWKAIAATTVCPHPQAATFKVAHHGSKNADEPAAWNRLLSTGPVVAVTPYRALRNPLPTPADVKRILSRTQELYCAGSRGGLKPPSRPSNVQKLIAGKIHVIDGRLGQVRLRLGPDGSSTVETFGASERLQEA